MSEGPVRFSVLGPLTVEVGGHRSVLRTGAPRTVLAVLLLTPNRPVSLERLADSVWGDVRPEAATGSLRNHVMRLRRQLGNSAGHRIRTTGSGYLVDVRDDELDETVFLHLCGRGRQALVAGDFAEASELLATALALWRGEPFAGIRLGPDFPIRAHQLEETRLLAAEGQIDAGLGLGRHRELVPRIKVLVDTHPLREAFHAQLMLALYRSDRQAEALESFHALRRTLVDEIGVEPSKPLQDLHRRIICADPDLRQHGGVRLGPDGEPLRADGAVAFRPRAEAGSIPQSPGRIEMRGPRQLPAAPRFVVGRDDVMAAMTQAYRASRSRVMALVGTGGIGKTTTALAWSHRQIADFPDGQLFVNLRGYDPGGRPVAPQSVVCELLHALGITPEQVPTGFAEQTALYRTLTADRRILIVLDNAVDSAQVRDLLPSGCDCLTVITSRDRLAGLVATDGALAVRLAPLTDAQALDLLAARLGGRESLDADESVRDLIAACSGLPLALTVVASRLSLEPDLATADLASLLRDTGGRLAELAETDAATDLRAVFSWSCQRLTPSASALFALLGLHPGPSISETAAAVLSAAPVSEVRPVLRELVEAHLLTPIGERRFQLHDLLQLYAAELAASDLDPATVEAARLRLLDHYLHSAFTADRLLNPSRAPIVLGDLDERAAPQTFATAADASAWMDREADVLTALSETAADTGYDHHAWQLPWTLARYLERRAGWRRLSQVLETAAAATDRLGDPEIRARTHFNAACGRWHVGEIQEAMAHLEQARSHWRALGDHAGLARIERLLADICGTHGSTAEALEHAERAVAMFQSTGDRAGVATALITLAALHSTKGQFDRALDRAKETLAVVSRLSSPQGTDIAAYLIIARTRLRLGDHREALDYCRRAEELAGDLYLRADLLAIHAEAADGLGDHDRAREVTHEASAIVEELDLPEDDPVRVAVAARLSRYAHEG